MDLLINPVILYVGLAIGALGVLIALPRERVNPQLIGMILAAAGFGAVIVALAFRGFEAAGLPNPHFYIFAPIAILSALRVITHQQPVYSALYFILTILSSSALYLLMGAEFMAFALIIIYAGAILITYLFVIMLATQAPSETETDAISSYDAIAREPLWATIMGFAIVAVLTGMLAQGLPQVRPAGNEADQQLLLAELPEKVLDDLSAKRVFREMDRPATESIGTEYTIDAATRTFTLNMTPEGASDLLARAEAEDRQVAKLLIGDGSTLADLQAAAASGGVVRFAVAPEVTVTNLDTVGWSLIAGHPLALEIAGVILLMAMLGAVVLARKQIDIGEDEKLKRAAELGIHTGPTDQADAPSGGAA